MSAFEDFLTSEIKPKVDADQLRMLAKKAAARFVKEETPLNESIAELSKEASLNPEQTRRVVELANVETFANLFDGDYDKNIDFDVANYAEITGKVGKKKQANTKHLVKVSKLQTYVPGQEYGSLEEVFAVETEEEKTADTTAVEFFAARDKVKLAVDEFAATAERLDEEMVWFQAKLGEAFKDGMNSSVAALFMKEAGVPLAVSELVIPEYFTKVAAVIELDELTTVNTEHPLFKEAQELASVANKFFGDLDMLRGTVEECDPVDDPVLAQLIKKSLGSFTEVV